MICPKCGQNIEDNKFCPFCGFGITEENSQNIIENEKLDSESMFNEEEKGTNEQGSTDEDEYIDINNNPFSYSGRITRLPYFLTSLVILVFLYINNCIKYLYNKTHNDSILSILYVSFFVMIIMTIIGFFAMIKRLRDIKWNPWLCLISLVPIVNYIFGLILLFMKSRYKDTANSKLS